MESSSTWPFVSAFCHLPDIYKVRHVVVFVHVKYFVLFYGWIIPFCNILLFVYPFINWWTFILFLIFNYYIMDKFVYKFLYE